MENDESDSTQNKTCPKCGAVVTPKQDNLIYSPFCSDLCKSKDLWSWLSGQYYIAESLQVDDSHE